MNYLRYCVVISLLLVVSGCQTVPKDAFKLSATSLQDRQLQSRMYDTADEIALLSAGIHVLQDLGYTVDETEKNLGLVTASKHADAVNSGQIAGAVFLALLTGNVQTAYDKEQKIKVSFVTLPSKKEKGKYIARITFQRTVWNTQGQITTSETVKDKEIYNGFFDKLSKSVFLEAHQI
ncbi:hypothetical protein [Algicola sagamiensis]|uniref:hypothetical protein n=1 Tax=Algicola sagamiensis TaxID=163869 RepID=UPI000361A023|nr:hypothetical protein [Algicola sagamiensis]